MGGAASRTLGDGRVPDDRDLRQLPGLPFRTVPPDGVAVGCQGSRGWTTGDDYLVPGTNAQVVPQHPTALERVGRHSGALAHSTMLSLDARVPGGSLRGERARHDPDGCDRLMVESKFPRCDLRQIF